MTEILFFNPTKKLSKNKNLEIQSGIFENWSYFEFMLKLNRNTDHAGLNFYIEVFGLYFIFEIYDGRHWDYDKNQWYVAQNTFSNPQSFNAKDFKAPGISTKEYDESECNFHC